jgi:hypothetical protein
MIARACGSSSRRMVDTLTVALSAVLLLPLLLTSFTHSSGLILAHAARVGTHRHRNDRTAPSSGGEGNIAIGVYGSSEQLKTWRSEFSHFRNNSKMRLFLLSTDITANQRSKHVYGFHLNLSGTATWASSRNVLGRHMFHHEEHSGHAFRYWVFANVSALQELNCIIPTADNFKLSLRPMYCMSEFLASLLDDRYSWAQVSVVLNNGGAPANVFAPFDCADSYVNAFHRAAVPVVFPYVDRLESVSASEAQAISHRVSAGCLPKGGVGTHFFSSRKSSSSTNIGTLKPTVRQAVMHEVFGNKALCPHPILCNSSSNSDARLHSAGDCYAHYRAREAPGRTSTQFHVRADTAVVHLPFESPIYLAMSNRKYLNESANWYHTPEFHYCLNKLRKRFLSFVSGKSLQELDGPKIVSSK